LPRSFISDNTAGAAREVVEAVLAASTGHAPPYSDDDWTARVRHRLRELFERDIDVVPVSTGLRRQRAESRRPDPAWGSVLCHRDSHIANDECAVPEFFTGDAKLVLLGGQHGQIAIPPSSRSRRAPLPPRGARSDVHTVQPSVLSLTQVTETGSVYRVDQVHELAGIAADAGLRVHMDGARFANAVARLGCSPADLTWRAGRTSWRAQRSTTARFWHVALAACGL
jgi:threonine aldolase